MRQGWVEMCTLEGRLVVVEVDMVENVHWRLEGVGPVKLAWLHSVAGVALPPSIFYRALL